MLDLCSISHKGECIYLHYIQIYNLTIYAIGGAVLWSRSFTPAASAVASSAASPVNSLVREAIIQDKTEDVFEKDSYAIKFKFVNDLELIFVVRPSFMHI